MPPPVPRAEQDADAPTPFQRLSRLVLRHGMRRSVAAITAAVTLSSLAVVELIMLALGRGDALLAAVLTMATTLLLAPPVVALLLRLVYELEEARGHLAELAMRDELTGIANRRHFMAIVQREWDLSRRHGPLGSLLLIDVDGFKRVNDSHGHLCGDALLREIAAAVGGSLRQHDLLARYGGEEFVVYLPHTDAWGALDVAERIRERVRGTSVRCGETDVSASVSIGVAPIRAELPTLDWLFHEADTALYAAKSAGRDCVRMLEFGRSANGSGSQTPSFKS